MKKFENPIRPPLGLVAKSYLLSISYHLSHGFLSLKYDNERIIYSISPPTKLSIEFSSIMLFHTISSQPNRAVGVLPKVSFFKVLRFQSQVICRALILVVP